MPYQAPDFRTALDMDMATKGINERELGKLLGLTQQSISKWRHRNFPPLYRVDELKTIFGPASHIARMDFTKLALETPKLRVSAPSNVPSNVREISMHTFTRHADIPFNDHMADIRAWKEGQWMEFMNHLPGNLRVHYKPTSAAAHGVSYMSTNAIAGVMMAARGFPLMPEALGDLAIRMLAAKAMSESKARLVLFLLRGKFTQVRLDAGDRWSRVSSQITERLEVVGVELCTVDSGAEMAKRICDLEGVEYVAPRQPEYETEDD